MKNLQSLSSVTSPFLLNNIFYVVPAFSPRKPGIIGSRLQV